MGELPPEHGRNLYEALETETLTTLTVSLLLGRWNHRRLFLLFLRKYETVVLFSLNVSQYIVLNI